MPNHEHLILTKKLAARRSARRTGSGELSRKKRRVSRRRQRTNQLACGQDRRADIDRPSGMMLDPLAKVRIRVLVPIRVGGSQLMMHVLRDGKGGYRQEKQDHADG